LSSELTFENFYQDIANDAVHRKIKELIQQAFSSETKSQKVVNLNIATRPPLAKTFQRVVREREREGERQISG